MGKEAEAEADTAVITAPRIHRATAVGMAEGIVAEGTVAETAGAVAVEMEEVEAAGEVVIEDLFSSSCILQIRSIPELSSWDIACVGNVA